MKSKTRMSDLKAMSDDQLEQEVLSLKKEQFNLRFQRATGQLENTRAGARRSPRHRARQDAGRQEARRQPPHPVSRRRSKD